MFNASLAQDVWKDPGKNVSFIVLALNRQDLTDEQEQVANFADMSQAIIRSMRIRKPEAGLQVAIGFSNQAWDYLFPNAKKPQELETYQTLTGAEYSMPASDGDIFLHIRASEEAVVYEIVRQFMKLLAPVTTVIDETKGFRYLEGRAIIGFIDGTEAPAPEDAADYAIIGDEDSDFINGSYAFAQKWQHDMAFWENLSVEHQEKAVGRHKFDDMELDDDDKLENAHNVASKLEIDGEEQKIIRMNVPFSDPAMDYTGTYFIGYARHWQVTKQMLEQMLEKSDFLLTFSTLLSGQLFFIPSRDTLADIADGNFFN
ncbi:MULTISPECIES: Dyp-type peroxidase [Weissella]|uniref:Dyp-type peroxidase n=2 Tax=Weissella TaxID=46255 RepID=A0ABX9I6G0_9LACO|nr:MULTISPECIES: Dyp-type peroxidase [Weissella]APS41702.1 putative dye-decolorizing peroxidase (DyP), encapsulated subgroup [Weissella jogaejeotgali]NKY90536.1 Dyp-type peroxidase [Weissella thailandensis]RDS60097.1 Dyp-type peroxidase [Weissella thailandensis]GEP73810.1 peroxidase [Weissella thailandensis]